MNADNTALVVGASGITGSNLAEMLVAKGWRTYGLSRNPRKEDNGVTGVAADLLDPKSLGRLVDFRFS